MISLKMIGGPELAKAILALPQEVRQPVLIEALMAAGRPMQDRMRTLAPRGDDPSHLADNIVMQAVQSFEGVKVTETEAAVAIGPEKSFFYGFFWEFGTVKLSARPFMRPAFDSGIGYAVATIGRALWAALSRARR